MQKVKELLQHVIDRVNVSLRHMGFDAEKNISGTIKLNKLLEFYSFYGLNRHNPLHFHFSNSSLAGTYFLGKCAVDRSILYKSDIRGDELKRKGDKISYGGVEYLLQDDESILIRNSFLVKTLVHNCSQDPENPDQFLIKNTAAMPFANIHGSRVGGTFLGAFSTIDLTTLYNSVVGVYAYLQADEVYHHFVAPGQIWIAGSGDFDFKYVHDPQILSRYIDHEPGKTPTGVMIDFIEEHKKDFDPVFSNVRLDQNVKVPEGASLSPYAVVKGRCTLGENVLVAQRSYLEDAWLGPGANAQENCFIISSHLDGFDVTAHGGKIICAHLGEKVFVGFNSFLRGTIERSLKIGSGCVVMPHTIIDLEKPLEIPENHIIWGYIRNASDLGNHSMPIHELAEIRGDFKLGGMQFSGNGEKFIQAFKRRIEHVLEANGAYFDGKRNIGHAQKSQDISYNLIQPYSTGSYRGIYPTIDIRP